MIIGAIGGAVTSILAYLKWAKRACFKPKEPIQDLLELGEHQETNKKGDDGNEKSVSTTSPDEKGDDGND